MQEPELSPLQKLLVDNSLSPRLSEKLQELGLDAIHVRDVIDPSSSDDVVFERAAAEGRVLIAADTDFGTILAGRRAVAPSVVIVRTARKATEYVLGLLQSNLPLLRDDLAAGSVVVFEDGRIRVRRLAIV